MPQVILKQDSWDQDHCHVYARRTYRVLDVSRQQYLLLCSIHTDSVDLMFGKEAQERVMEEGEATVETNARTLETVVST